MKRHRLFTALRILILVAVLIVITGPEWPAFQDERHKINAILGQRHFDFLVWEIGALSTKAEAAIAGGQSYLDEDTRKEAVLDYLELLGEVRRLESTIRTVFSDPSIPDPEAETAEWQREVDEKRLILEHEQPMIEAILQEQIAAVLVDAGFDLLGSAWPPVEMHMTALPFVLIVSPREEIRQIHNIPLEHGLSTLSREEIEEAINDGTDRSALVVSIGGLGIFPSMILESSNINYLADVVSHEWAHHWLTLHPIGLNYAANPALRTMNETIASIVGEEIGRSVIEKYYPEFVPAPPPENGSPVETEVDPDALDLSTELRTTRIQVDKFLAAGAVEEAEEYMEERRQFIWDHGYRIRKINQAFFAFYGAYADTPGEQGDDPIGPALLALRDDSSSLREFMDRISVLTSLEHLQNATQYLESPAASN
jgi:hypothetical protein